jgi:hypothetical protein
MASANKSIPFVVSSQVVPRPEPVTQQIRAFAKVRCVNEKPKSERIQKTISGEDAADIRNLSVLEFRTFADELRYVIQPGLNVAKERLRFEHSEPQL